MLSLKKEGLAGLLFIFWWIGMWCLTLFVVEIDRGAGVVMGFPLFVLGILFIGTEKVVYPGNFANQMNMKKIG